MCDVLRARSSGDGIITPAGVELLIEQMLRAGELSKLRLPGLADERLPVFPGGLAILAEVLSVLDIKTMKAADGALREGLLYDLVGRFTDEDARLRSVRAMQGRYHVDLAQASASRPLRSTFCVRRRPRGSSTIRLLKWRCRGPRGLH